MVLHVVGLVFKSVWNSLWAVGACGAHCGSSVHCHVSLGKV